MIFRASLVISVLECLSGVQECLGRVITSVSSSVTASASWDLAARALEVRVHDYSKLHQKFDDLDIRKTHPWSLSTPISEKKTNTIKKQSLS